MWPFKKKVAIVVHIPAKGTGLGDIYARMGDTDADDWVWHERDKCDTLTSIVLRKSKKIIIVMLQHDRDIIIRYFPDNEGDSAMTIPMSNEVHEAFLQRYREFFPLVVNATVLRGLEEKEVKNGTEKKSKSTK